jgi:hypothetical protein
MGNDPPEAKMLNASNPLFPLLFLILLTAACSRVPQRAAEATSAAPAESTLPCRGVAIMNEECRHLIYLHGQIVEGSGGRPEHPRFGVYEYERIVATLRERGLEVISEVRPAGTRVDAYAGQVAEQVEELIATGVKPSHITVAGHSKGGAIAIYTSSIVDRAEVNFVFLACCGRWVGAPDAPRVRGRILSIFEASDELGRSCQPAFKRAREGTVHHEIEIAIGGGHGAFFRPDPAWIEPLVDWARGGG